MACVSVYTPAIRFPGYEAIPPVLGTLLILHFENGIANRFLSMRAMVAVGLISYSLYLWHWPLLSFAAIIDSETTPVSLRAMLMLLATGSCNPLVLAD